MFVRAMCLSSELVVTYGRVESETDLKAIREILEITYLISDEEREGFHKRMPADQIRIVKRDGQVVGGMRLIPLAQWFGGSSVAMSAVSAVGVSPRSRSQGVGTELMRECLAEMRETGYPVSTLYPATVPLYRRHGWERAGTFYHTSIAAKDIDVRGRELELVEVSDIERLKPIYDRHARRSNGLLARSEITWDRILNPRGSETVHTYVAGSGEGYVVFTQDRDGGFQYNLNCRDMVSLTPAAGRTIWSFFADHRSFVKDVRWGGPPDDAMLTHLSEQYFNVDRRFNWMLRVVDVETAIAARGYPEGLSTTVDVRVTDSVCPWNDGEWRLTFEGGVGRAERGGTPSITADVRGLAASYTGFTSPQRLVATGLFEGDDGELRKLGAAFAGPNPHLTDWF